MQGKARLLTGPSACFPSASGTAYLQHGGAESHCMRHWEARRKMKCVHLKPQPCSSLQQAQKQAFQLEVAPSCSSQRSHCSRVPLCLPLPTSQQLHTQQERLHLCIRKFCCTQWQNQAMGHCPPQRNCRGGLVSTRHQGTPWALRVGSQQPRWSTGAEGMQHGCASLALSLQPPPSCHLLGINGMHSSALWVVTWSATADITSPHSSHYPASPRFPICRTRLTQRLEQGCMQQLLNSRTELLVNMQSL